MQLPCGTSLVVNAFDAACSQQALIGNCSNRDMILQVVGKCSALDRCGMAACWARLSGSIWTALRPPWRSSTAWQPTVAPCRCASFAMCDVSAEATSHDPDYLQLTFLCSAKLNSPESCSSHCCSHSAIACRSMPLNFTFQPVCLLCVCAGLQHAAQALPAGALYQLRRRRGRPPAAGC